MDRTELNAAVDAHFSGGDDGQGTAPSQPDSGGGPDFGLPPLTDQERKEFGMDRQDSAQPAAELDFEYDGKKFSTKKDLSDYIRTLHQPQKPPEQDIESRFAKLMEDRFRQFEERMGGRQQPQQEARPARQQQENPFDPEAETAQWHKWEMDNLRESMRLDMEERMEALRGPYERLAEQNAEAEGKRAFESIYAETAKANGFDPDLADFVKELTLADPNGVVHQYGSSAAPAEMTRIYRDLKSVIDRKVERGIQSIIKSGTGLPPSVTRGGGAPITRMEPPQDEPVTELKGKNSSMNFLRRMQSGGGLPGR